MITQKVIDEFIDKIPPAPKVLMLTLSFINDGELTKAAQIAEQDLALKTYLKHLVNRPIYGFKNEVSEVSQIFGILGLSGSQQSVYNYMMTLLSPEKWEFFKLTTNSFYSLQAELSGSWKKILNHLNIKDKEIESAIALLPASVIVAEALFNTKKDDVNLLRSSSEIDLNTILKRLAGRDLFDISQQIAIKWDMPSTIIEIVQASSGIKPSSDKRTNHLAKWMHLLLFYTLSKPTFIDSELNDFIEFKIDYVADIYDDFATLMEIS
jgi:HD-like signal output (HDOD) protein